jgi:hypothetical protein
MSDTSTAVADALAAIAADREAKVAAAAAAAEAEETRVAKLDAAKAVCAVACGPVADALAASSDPSERQALADLEAQTHESHRVALEEAYLEFAGQRRGDSNPSGPEGALTSNVVVVGDAQA